MRDGIIEKTRRTGKRRILQAFTINEISAVDRPAQEHALATIMKWDEPRREKISPEREPPSFDTFEALASTSNATAPLALWRCRRQQASTPICWTSTRRKARLVRALRSRKQSSQSQSGSFSLSSRRSPNATTFHAPRQCNVHGASTRKSSRPYNSREEFGVWLCPPFAHRCRQGLASSSPCVKGRSAIVVLVDRPSSPTQTVGRTPHPPDSAENICGSGT